MPAPWRRPSSPGRRKSARNGAAGGRTTRRDPAGGRPSSPAADRIGRVGRRPRVPGPKLGPLGAGTPTKSARIAGSRRASSPRDIEHGELAVARADARDGDRGAGCHGASRPFWIGDLGDRGRRPRGAGAVPGESPRRLPGFPDSRARPAGRYARPGPAWSLSPHAVATMSGDARPLPTMARGRKCSVAHCTSRPASFGSDSGLSGPGFGRTPIQAGIACLPTPAVMVLTTGFTPFHRIRALLTAACGEVLAVPKLGAGLTSEGELADCHYSNRHRNILPSRSPTTPPAAPHATVSPPTPSRQ
jgi:hypothetical protein